MAAGRQNPHGPEPARGDEVARPSHPPALGGEHLVLPHPGGDHRIGRELPLEPLDHLGRVEALARAFPGPAALLQRVQLGAPRRARIPAAAGQRPQQRPDHLAQVALERQRGRHALRQLVRIDVDLNDAGCRGEAGLLPDPALGEARPQRQDEVRALRGLVGVGVSVHADHAQPERVILGHRPLALEAGHERHPEPLRQLAHHRRGPAAPHPAAQVQQRALGAHEQVHRLGQGGRRGRTRRLGGNGAVSGRDARELDVPGDVDQDRAGSAGAGQVKCLGQRLAECARLADHAASLGDGRGDGRDVGLLEGAGARLRGGDVSGDGHQRHAIVERVGDAGDEVGRAGARGGQAHAHPAGRVGIALGRVGRDLLVTHQHVGHTG